MGGRVGSVVSRPNKGHSYPRKRKDDFESYIITIADERS